MCKNNRKYQEYNIKVTYLNGDTETIKYKGVNTSNYKDMLNLYRDVKEDYKNESVTIDFVGKTEDGRLGILFTKEIKNKDAELKEYSEKIKNIETKDILKKILDDMNLLSDKFEDSKKHTSILDKEISNKMHDIENAGKNVADSFKIKIYDDISDLENERRIIKNDFKHIFALEGKLQSKGLNLNKLEDIFKLKLKDIESIEEDKKNYNILTNEKAEELKIMKRVKYKNFKERIRLIAELKKDYQKVYYDNSTMEVICYNKAKAI